MSNFFITITVRSLFTMTSRRRAVHQAKSMLDRYMGLAEGLTPEAGRHPVEVPPMRGVDEDMRGWSFYMILHHNGIVNRSISATIRQLVHGEPLSGAAAMDFKKDVMPSPSAGEEQVEAFRDSIHEHVEMVKGLGRLRGTKTSLHPVFGEFDAHKWNCMLPFHLQVHYKQAERVVAAAKAVQWDSGDR